MGGINFQGNVRNIAVYILLSLGLLGITVGTILGQKQDKDFREDYQAFVSADYNLAAGNISSAAPVLASLADRYPNSYNVIWDYGLSLLAQGEYLGADKYLTQVKVQHPFIINNDLFLLQYGTLQFDQGRYQMAEKYLLRLKQISQDPLLMQRADIQLKKIETGLH